MRVAVFKAQYHFRPGFSTKFLYVLKSNFLRNFDENSYFLAKILAYIQILFVSQIQPERR